MNDEYLLKAINSFKRKILVISPDFNILAINNNSNQAWEDDIVGKSCYQALYGRTSHCLNCPAVNVLETKKPTMMDRKALANEDKMLCRYSYPILSGDNIDALVIFDFEFPALEGLEERLKRSNSFLRNLILSSVDGVIAADMSGSERILTRMGLKVLTAARGNEALDIMEREDVSIVLLDLKMPGLGPPIVKGLLNDLGGSVSVESAPGEGSVFTVSIPVIKQESSPN